MQVHIEERLDDGSRYPHYWRVWWDDALYEDHVTALAAFAATSVRTLAGASITIRWTTVTDAGRAMVQALSEAK
jgi:hypothetical protein